LVLSFSSLLQRAFYAPNHPALLGDPRCSEKKSAKLNLKIIDAANSDRVAYWRKLHLYLHRKQIKIKGE
jgi:hypothetical protein